MDPRIEAFNTDFHKEKYGPDNHGESFEQQRQEELGMLKLAYWLDDSSFIKPQTKTIVVSVMLVCVADRHLSFALASRLTGIVNALYTGTL